MNKDLRNAIERAKYLLNAAARFMEANPIAAEYTVIYDDAVRDGDCLADDCEIAVTDLELYLSA